MVKGFGGCALLPAGICLATLGVLYGCGDSSGAGEENISQAGSSGSPGAGGGDPVGGSTGTAGASAGSGGSAPVSDCSAALPPAGGEFENAVLMSGPLQSLESFEGACDGTTVAAGAFLTALRIAPAVGAASELMQLTTGNDTANPMFATRIGSSGDVTWSHALPRHNTIGAQVGPYIAAFSDGSTVESGSFEGSVILGQGQPNEVRLSGNVVDGYLAKYAADGGLLWVKHLDVNGAMVWAVQPGPDGSTHALIEIGYGGGVLAPGELDLELPGLGTVALVTLDADGTFVRATRIAGAGGYGSYHRLAALPDGRVVVLAQGGELVFAEGTPNAVTLSSGGFEARFGPELELESAKVLPSGQYQIALLRPVPFADGSVIIAAESLDDVPAVASSQRVVARFDPQGALGWALHVGATAESMVTLTALAALLDGTTWIGGDLADNGIEGGSVVIGLGSAQPVTLDIPPGSAYVARIAPDGALDWAKPITSDGWASLMGLVASSHGVAVAGRFAGTLALSPNVAVPQEDEGVFVVKLGP